METPEPDVIAHNLPVPERLLKANIQTKDARANRNQYESKETSFNKKRKSHRNHDERRSAVKKAAHTSCPELSSTKSSPPSVQSPMAVIQLGPRLLPESAMEVGMQKDSQKGLHEL